MPTERYFLDDFFTTHHTQELKGPEFHHLAHVMRARKGEKIELVNGQGALAQASVQILTKDKAVLYIEHVFQEAENSCRLILAQAFPKSNHLDFILEKGTELGVDSFWLFPGQLSIKKDFFPQQIERARSVMIAAMKQCGRLTLPSLILQPPLRQWPILASSSAFFGDLAPEAPLFEVAWEKTHFSSYPLMFITGPEGGFHEQEIQLLRDQGAQGVKLHQNILRTETASLMAMSLLSHWLLIP